MEEENIFLKDKKYSCSNDFLNNPKLLLFAAGFLLFLLLIICIDLYLILNQEEGIDFNNIEIDMSGDYNLSINAGYTPSENLAIIEGRFLDAKKSIQRREILDGK